MARRVKALATTSLILILIYITMFSVIRISGKDKEHGKNKRELKRDVVNYVADVYRNLNTRSQDAQTSESRNNKPLMQNVVEKSVKTNNNEQIDSHKREIGNRQLAMYDEQTTNVDAKPGQKKKLSDTNTFSKDDKLSDKITNENKKDKFASVPEKSKNDKVEAINTQENVEKVKVVSTANPNVQSAVYRNCTANSSLPVIYVITPTFKRLYQIPELTRVTNTLKHVPALHWIVIEEGNRTLPEVNSLLESSGINFTYINAKPYTNVSKSLKGIHQRNKGIFWLRKNVDLSKDGVVFFADDDNTYDIRLFEEMRYTKKVSVWPVGFVSKRKYQTPIVKNGKIVKFDAWNTKNRKFAVDMAGFGLNTKMFYYNPHLYFWKTFKVGYQETMFLEICCKLSDLEPRADNCSKVLVWHTKAMSPIINHQSYNDSDPVPIDGKDKSKPQDLKDKKKETKENDKNKSKGEEKESKKVDSDKKDKSGKSKHIKSDADKAAEGTNENKDEDNETKSEKSKQTKSDKNTADEDESEDNNEDEQTSSKENKEDVKVNSNKKDKETKNENKQNESDPDETENDEEEEK